MSGKKRWLLFGFNDYYPQGGFDDFMGFFHTPEDAADHFEQVYAEDVLVSGHIVDRENVYEQIWTVEKNSEGEIVWELIDDPIIYGDMLPRADIEEDD